MLFLTYHYQYYHICNLIFLFEDYIIVACICTSTKHVCFMFTVSSYNDCSVRQLDMVHSINCLYAGTTSRSDYLGLGS